MKIFLLFLYSISIYASDLNEFDILSQPENIKEYRVFLKNNLEVLSSLNEEPSSKYLNSILKIFETSSDQNLKLRLLEDIVINETTYLRFMHKIFKMKESNTVAYQKMTASLYRLRNKIPKTKANFKFPIRCTTAALTYLASRDFTHSFAASFIDLKNYEGHVYKERMNTAKNMVIAYTAFGCFSDIVETYKTFASWKSVVLKNMKNKEFLTKLLKDLETLDNRKNIQDALNSKAAFFERRDSIKTKVLADLWGDAMTGEKLKKSTFFDNFGSPDHNEQFIRAIRKAYTGLTPEEKRKVINLIQDKKLNTKDLDVLNNYSDLLLDALEKDISAKLKIEGKNPEELFKESFQIEDANLKEYVESYRPSKLTKLCQASIGIGFVYLGMGAALGGKDNDLDNFGEEFFRNSFFKTLPYVGPMIAAPCFAQVMTSPSHIAMKLARNTVIRNQVRNMPIVRRQIINASKMPKDGRILYSIGDNLEDLIEKHEKFTRSINLNSLHIEKITFSNKCIVEVLNKSQSELRNVALRVRKPANKSKQNCLEHFNSLTAEITTKGFAQILEIDGVYLNRVKKAYLAELIGKLAHFEELTDIKSMRSGLRNVINSCK